MHLGKILKVVFQWDPAVTATNLGGGAIIFFIVVIIFSGGGEGEGGDSYNIKTLLGY